MSLQHELNVNVLTDSWLGSGLSVQDYRQLPRSDKEIVRVDQRFGLDLLMLGIHSVELGHSTYRNWELLSEKKRFMQNSEAKTGTLQPISYLFPEHVGKQTVERNADLFVKRDIRGGGLCANCCTMQIFCANKFLPGRGAAFRRGDFSNGVFAFADFDDWKKFLEYNLSQYIDYFRSPIHYWLDENSIRDGKCMSCGCQGPLIHSVFTKKTNHEPLFYNPHQVYSEFAGPPESHRGPGILSKRSPRSTPWVLISILATTYASGLRGFSGPIKLLRVEHDNAKPLIFNLYRFRGWQSIKEKTSMYRLSKSQLAQLETLIPNFCSIAFDASTYLTKALRICMSYNIIIPTQFMNNLEKNFYDIISEIINQDLTEKALEERKQSWIKAVSREMMQCFERSVPVPSASSKKMQNYVKACDLLRKGIWSSRWPKSLNIPIPSKEKQV